MDTSKTIPAPDGFAAALQSGAAEMMQAWSHSMDLYGRYLTALSQAKKPEDLIVANADLFTDGAASFTRCVYDWSGQKTPVLSPNFPE